MKRALAVLLLVAGCRAQPPSGPIAVDVIGVAAPRPDPNRGALAAPDAVLLAATAQGLVRFDAHGEIAPGLARRWDVSDDGLFYTFRLGPSGGAQAVARRLRAVLAATRNPLQSSLGAIREVSAVTPEVIELSLSAPRPHLFELLAQPEMTVIGGAGGPLRRDGDLLRPMTTDAPTPPPVRLAARRAALAVARFRAGRTDLVLGGSFTDLPVARAAAPPPGVLRFDPVAGLFGLAVTRPSGVLASADGRRALSLAIDRERIVRLIGAPGQTSASAIVPSGRAEAGLAQRRTVARTILGTLARPDAPPLRMLLPDSPGANLLFRLLQQDFTAVGVTVERVERGLAELRLLDAVAPADETVWQLRRFACSTAKVCSPEADALLAKARAAATLEARAAFLTQAAAELDAQTPFLPIASPVRWSLVAPSLDRFAENRRAAHPLDQLRTPARN